MMLAHTIRAAIDEGVTEYKLLRGGEEYKGRFATSDPGLESFAVGSGVVGGAAALAAGVAAGPVLPGGLRHRLAGLLN